jgi:amino acid transporter
MAVQGQLPLTLARVHPRFRTPYVSILLCVVTVLLLSLSGTFIYALKVTVITRVIVYASTCVAVPVLRWRSERVTPVAGEPASFRMPAGILISIVCVILCGWLLANSGWREARDVAVATAIGLVIYLLTRFRQKRAERM